MNNYVLLNYVFGVFVYLLRFRLVSMVGGICFFNVLHDFVNVGMPFCLVGKHVIGWIWASKGQRKECSFFTMLFPDGSHFHSFSLYPLLLH